jgi:hypothetical protein
MMGFITTSKRKETRMKKDKGNKDRKKGRGKDKGRKDKRKNKG